ncbi:MAG: tetratricopeptide repeat protein, partial [Polyangiaceae bacterium]
MMDGRRIGSRAVGWLALLIGVNWATVSGAQPQPVPPAAAPPAGSPAVTTGTNPGAPAPPATNTAARAPIAPSPAARVAPPAVPVAKKKPKPPPAPTAEQLAGLRELQREAERYERDAKDYRATITRIIRHHYEERRKRVLAALDREINIESQGLRAAREEAIRRLEVFVAKYSGANSNPQSTPDAMFRLAALYEERAREIVDNIQLAPGAAPPEPELRPAIALYKRIVREYDQYRELAGVYYYLGHAYNDSGRIHEAQQVWRSLVCHNRVRYPVAPDPKDPNKDTIVRLPQEHDSDWWLGWMQRHPLPLDEVRRRAAEKPLEASVTAAAEDASKVEDDEDTFKDPYPADCRPIAQEGTPGEDPRYLAEIWWQIGDFHFEEIDPYGGPFNLNRAESAYRQSMRYEKPPVYGVSMYKLAWTFYKQQRYKTAVEQFVRLLNYTDAEEKRTGNTGADFRVEAYAYIAGSVTYLDFEGPAQQDPYIARNDIFDLETDSAIIEQKMHRAIDRVRDATLVPQDKPWTVDIYKALAVEFKEYNQYQNLIEIDELI